MSYHLWGKSQNWKVFRPSATANRIGLMESCTCRCCGGPPWLATPSHPWLVDPPWLADPPPPRNGWLGRSAFALTKPTCFVAFHWYLKFNSGGGGNKFCSTFFPREQAPSFRRSAANFFFFFKISFSLQSLSAKKLVLSPWKNIYAGVFFLRMSFLVKGKLAFYLQNCDWFYLLWTEIFECLEDQKSTWNEKKKCFVITWWILRCLHDIHASCLFSSVCVEMCVAFSAKKKK